MERLTKKVRSATFLKYSTHLEEFDNCDLFITAVPKSPNDAKQPDFKNLKQTTALFGRHIEVGSSVILNATVVPGATD